MVARFRAPALACAVLLILLASAVPVPADPGPDAATCTRELPCPIGPGTHNGTLYPHIKPSAHYVLTPPAEPAVMRIEVRGDTEVRSYLHDPDGHARAAASNYWTGTASLAAVAAPSGEWHLEVRYSPFASTALFGNTFTLTLQWEIYENLTRIDTPAALSTSFTTEFTTEQGARLDVVYGTPGGENPFGEAYVAIQALLANVSGRLYGYGGVSQGCCGWVAPEVRTWGSLPEDVTVRLPLPPAEPFSLGALGIETDGTQGRLSYGLSFSLGLSPTTAWIAHNGDPPTFSFSDDDGAFYHRLTDFEGSGPALYAGGYAQAEGLTLEQELPGRDTHTTIFGADGTSAYGATRPAQVTLTPPAEGAIDLSGRDTLYWFDAQEGPWRVDVERLDGWERDHLRFYGASFGFALDSYLHAG